MKFLEIYEKNRTIKLFPPFQYNENIQKPSRINKKEKSISQKNNSVQKEKANQSKVRATCNLWLQCFYTCFYTSSKVSVNPQLNYNIRVQKEVICTFYLLITIKKRQTNKQNQLLKQIGVSGSLPRFSFTSMRF